MLGAVPAARAGGTVQPLKKVRHGGAVVAVISAVAVAVVRLFRVEAFRREIIRSVTRPTRSEDWRPTLKRITAPLYFVLTDFTTAPTGNVDNFFDMDLQSLLNRS